MSKRVNNKRGNQAKRKMRDGQTTKVRGRSHNPACPACPSRDSMESFVRALALHAAHKDSNTLAGLEVCATDDWWCAK